MAKKSRQEGHLSGIRNIRGQRKIDKKRARRKERFSKKGKRKHGSRVARYRRQGSW